MLGNNQFENFIIKKIVQRISFDATTLSLSFDKVVVSEKTMSEIQAEARHYDLTQDEIIQSIENARLRITQIPKKDTAYSNVDLDRIELGQHVRIGLRDDRGKDDSIELLYLSRNKFLVLDTTDNALQKGDELISVYNVWNINVGIDFTVFRNKVRFPDAVTIYRTTPFISIDYFHPSPVYEIYDSESDFRFLEESETEDNTFESKKLYSWYPSVLEPTPAFLDSEMLTDSNAPYIITFNRSGYLATFCLNTEWLSISPFYIDAFLDSKHAALTYNQQNKLDRNLPIKRLKVLKKGVLKKVFNAGTGQYMWVIKKRMFVKIVY